MSELSDTDKQIIKERFGYQYRLVATMNATEIVEHIKSFNLKIAAIELDLRATKAEQAANIQRLDTLNDEAKAAGFKEYVIPTRQFTEKPAKIKPNVPKHQIAKENKPIIDLFKTLKSVDSVISMLADVIDEATVRQVIRDYELTVQ